MSRLDERFLDELKGRLRLSEVIGRAVNLKRQGREWVGLSPFAKEKTPSFFVNDDKGFWHDFSSGKHGDLIAFLQENERLTFREAVERLAGEAGLALPADDPRQAAAEARSMGLREWLDEAARWYAAQLRRPPGEAARAYLDRRGLGAEDQARFGLGYAPAGRTALKDHLVARGARPGDLVDAGLLIAPEDGGAPYDRFRDRVMFPIADGRGRIVSFGGRALDPNARAKYLNGPETALFHKGRTLYGVPEARRLLQQAEVEKRSASLVVVEGYMDAIACARAGIAAVAGQGTALTEEQMEALWRLHPEPTLCFDGDAAGRRAADRALDRALPLLKPGRSFRFAVVEGAKDPDEVLREQGPEALRGQLERTEPFVARLFAREMSVLNIHKTPEARAGVRFRLRTLAKGIKDRDLSEEYGRELFERYKVETASDHNLSFTSRLNGLKGQAGPNAGLDTYNKAKVRIRRYNALVALGALFNPEWAFEIVEDLSCVGFGDKRMDDLVSPLVEALAVEGVDFALIVEHIRAAGALDALQRVFDYAFETDIALQMSLEDSAHAHQVWLMAARSMIELAYVEIELGERRPLNGVESDDHARRHLDRRRELRTRFLDLRAQTMAHEGWPWVNAILQVIETSPSEPVARWRKAAHAFVSVQREMAERPTLH